MGSPTSVTSGAEGTPSSEERSSDDLSARSRKRLVSLVVPCFNEEATVDRFWAALEPVLSGGGTDQFEVLFVDDGSTDATFDRLAQIAHRDDRVAVYSLARNFGHQVALSAGLDRARGDVLLLMDCDLQHPPELIPEFLARLDGGYDIVLGVRRTTREVGLLKRASSRAFYALFNALSDVKLSAGAADFVCMSRVVYRQLRRMRERHRFLRAMVSWLGFRRTVIEYVAPARVAGQSKYTLAKMMRLALDGVFAFSTRPLRFATRAGVMISALGLVYLGYIAFMSLATHATVPGWPSVIGTVILLGGFQISVTGLIGEYVARTFEETKQRPLYVVRAFVGRSKHPKKKA
jgi:glycosyltransferase involved in cell wall biosynthesis